MTSTKPPAVEIDAITKSYGETTAIRGVFMDVRDGEFVTILGRAAAENPHCCA
ncbi:hypothetical protein [Shinella sedimenti]|uniref:ABC transporter ATP-binding protein n=1 Tax=Shinella sedimenti TaxID=2919913 RepID=A0ABT0CRS0_9HYPH|nr:hypothetical protein [Shinella sedimenti]MCJ8151291.1 hypothetical protein [Shinella sedimenti]